MQTRTDSPGGPDVAAVVHGALDTSSCDGEEEETIETPLRTRAEGRKGEEREKERDVTEEDFPSFGGHQHSQSASQPLS